MDHLQFKFGMVPSESATTCLNCQDWLEGFEVQTICELSIKYGLLFMKNVVVHFCNTLLVAASQKSPFSAL